MIRLLDILNYKDFFSRQELEYYFSGTFIDSKKMEKFFKKFFTKINRNISKDKFETFKKVYPIYVKQKMTREHPMLDDMYELKIFVPKKNML